ncbi:MAG: hypothetical protein ACYDGL_01555 [Bellilinea sp.]
MYDPKISIPGVTQENIPLGAVVMGAGVDPGISTMIRALFEVWTHTGQTYANFGPGMSMGYTVAAKSCKGVADSLSITHPGNPGCHAPCARFAYAA